MTLFPWIALRRGRAVSFFGGRQRFVDAAARDQRDAIDGLLCSLSAG